MPLRGGSRLMETHQGPDDARSDGPNMVRFSAFEDFLRQVTAFDAVAKG